MISFEMRVDQNKYLPIDGRVMHAAISLMCTAGAAQLGATPVGDVSLRLWTPDDVDIRLLQQISPHISDLTDRGSPAGPRFMDYPTGQWGTETKIYHLVVEAPPQGAGVQRAAARVSVMAGGQELLEETVWIQWTNDLHLSTQVNPLVAQVSGQLELLKSVQMGLEAREAGNIEEATEMLGRAVRLAAESESHDTLRVLKRFVEIINVADGTVRLLRNVDNVQAEMVKLESPKTTVIRRACESDIADLSSEWVCSLCRSSSEGRYCGRCGADRHGATLQPRSGT